jgi:two-component system sensor histidine kinase BarA
VIKAQSIQPSLPKTDRIDWAIAMQRAGGKADLALDMLNMLLDSLPEARDSIATATDENDHEAVLRHVHKLHGACCYTGVPRLKNLALLIESHIKKAQNTNDIMPELYELIDEIDNLLTECAPWRVTQPTE